MSYDGPESRMNAERFTPSSSTTDISALQRIQLAIKPQDVSNGIDSVRAYTVDPVQPRPTITPLSQSRPLPEPPLPSPHNVDMPKVAAEKCRGAHLATWKEDEQSVERMWAIYLDHAEKVGPRARAWRADADGVLTFSALFSALVSVFMIESYKAFKPDYSAASALMLSQLVLMHNATNLMLPDMAQAVYDASLSDALGRASPCDYVTNALWISSLLVSVTSALCAVMIQQWTRRFESMCDGHFHRSGVSYEKAARVRLHVLGAARADEFAKYIETIPRYLHAAVFLFIVGLLFFFTRSEYLIICICIGFSMLYLFDWYASMTMSVLRNPATLFQTPLTTGLWLFATKFLVKSDPPRAFGDVFRQAFFGMFYIPGDIRQFYSLKNSSTKYPSLKEHRNLSFDDAVVSALGNSEPDAEFTAAELTAVFHKLCVPQPDALDTSCAFLMGLCSIVAPIDVVPPKVDGIESLILRRLYDGTSQHGSWESWLFSVLSACDTDSSLALQFAALCLQLHYLQLVRLDHEHSSPFPYHSPEVSIPDSTALAALLELESHPISKIALAAQCFRVWLAAGMSVDYDSTSLSSENVFWTFVLNESDWRQWAEEVGIDPVALARPKNRSVAIASSLQSAIYSCVVHPDETPALVKCIHTLADQIARAIELKDLYDVDSVDDGLRPILDALCGRFWLPSEVREALSALRTSVFSSPSEAQNETSAIIRDNTMPSSSIDLSTTSQSSANPLWRTVTRIFPAFSTGESSTSTSISQDSEKLDV